MFTPPSLSSKIDIPLLAGERDNTNEIKDCEYKGHEDTDSKFVRDVDKIEVDSADGGA
jgi:hypothetical protein